MSTPPRILELRLSFIFTETFPTLLAGAAPSAPMAFLGHPDGFSSEYEEIKQRMSGLEQQWKSRCAELVSAYYNDPKTLVIKKAEVLQELEGQLNGPDVLMPPWPWLGHNYVHHFWQYYFENTEPNTFGGSQAWQYVVPLRVNIPARIGSPWTSGGPKCRLMAEGFFYPHGIAVAIMVQLLFRSYRDGTGATPAAEEPGAGPALMMERALQVRKDLALPVTLPDGTSESLKLDALAAQLLDYLREKALGKKAPQGSRPSQPLTVATVLRGRGGDASLPITPKSDLHRVLEGLCGWKDDWAQRQDLKPLAEANLLINSPSPGHVAYHLDRGRAVWMPGYFASPARRDEHRLSCYHRNLSLVCLQTEMLAQVTVLYTDYLDRGETPPPALESLARFAAIRLGYLYAVLKKGSKKYTYNSASPRAYLQENGYVDIINQARESFEPKLSPLTYKRW